MAKEYHCKICGVLLTDGRELFCPECEVSTRPSNKLPPVDEVSVQLQSTEDNIREIRDILRFFRTLAIIGIALAAIAVFGWIAMTFAS